MVEQAEALAFASKHGITYTETSANTGLNIKELFAMTISSRLPIPKPTAEEQKNVEKWIKDVNSLAEKAKTPGDKAKITAVATTAAELINNPPKFPTDPRIQGFAAAVNATQNLKIEKLSWKNVLNAFCFIPSLVHYAKTGKFLFTKEEAVGDKLKSAAPLWLKHTTGSMSEDKKDEKEIAQKHHL